MAIECESDESIFALADCLRADYGLLFALYSTESGWWIAEFSLPRWDGHLGDGYVRARTRAEAVRLAAEQALEVLGVTQQPEYLC